MFTLPPLPYELNALEPFMSRNTLDFHYHKHHQNYVNTLKILIENTQWAKMSLEEIITTAPVGSPIFNNAAQVWNHTFFWNSMQPDGGRRPTGELLQRLEQTFGSYDGFKQKFKQTAIEQFGSGWVWLAEDKNQNLQIISTSNADSPLAHNLKPLITCDVWEHAYYLDYQNRRQAALEALWNIIDWKVVEGRYEV